MLIEIDKYILGWDYFFIFKNTYNILRMKGLSWMQILSNPYIG